MEAARRHRRTLEFPEGLGPQAHLGAPPRTHAFQVVIPEHDAESWLLNKLVHNNDWANGTEADLRPVFTAAKDFLSLFRCDNPDCESWIAVSGRTGAEDPLRCACQAYSLNLKRK